MQTSWPRSASALAMTVVTRSVPPERSIPPEKKQTLVISPGEAQPREPFPPPLGVEAGSDDTHHWCQAVDAHAAPLEPINGAARKTLAARPSRFLAMTHINMSELMLDTT